MLTNLIDAILGIFDKLLSIFVDLKRIRKGSAEPLNINVYQECDIDNRCFDLSTHYHMEVKESASLHAESSSADYSYDISTVIILGTILLFLYEYLYWIKLTIFILWLCSISIFIYFERRNLKNGLNYVKIRLAYWVSYPICFLSLILADESIDINLWSNEGAWSVVHAIFVVFGMIFILLALFNPFSSFGQAFCQSLPFTYKRGISKCILCSLLSLGLSSGIIYNAVYYLAHFSVHTSFLI